MQRPLGKKPAQRASKTHPGQARASVRKASNRAARAASQTGTNQMASVTT